MSSYAYTILTQNADKCVINIKKNPIIVPKVKRLSEAIEIRGTAKVIASYIQQCRFSDEIKPELKEILEIEDVHIMSLNQLCSIKLGYYFKNISKEIELAKDHVNNCELCFNKGFICEFCRDKENIFPFQGLKVYQCPICWSCYHTNCYESKKFCIKCKRLQNKKKSKAYLVE